MIVEVREKRQSQHDVALAYQRLRDAVDSIDDGFAMFDGDDHLSVCNRKYIEIWACLESPAAAEGLTFAEIAQRLADSGLVAIDGDDTAAWLARHIGAHRRPPAEPRIEQLADGRWLRINERRTPDGGSVAIVSDITNLVMREQQMKEARRRAEFLAYHDALTGLPNRALLGDRLRQALLDYRSHGHRFALLMIDLDGFKTVNDTFGHDVGDILLQAVTQRLLSCLRNSDTLARLGGDEFAVLMTHLREADNAAMVAGRMVEACGGSPIEVGGRSCRIGASIGIALFPDHALSTDALLVAADTALYKAKRLGKQQFAWAESVSNDRVCEEPHISWSEIHSVGVRQLDDQHIRMTELLNRLGCELKHGESPEKLAAALADIRDFAKLHFATEEELMRQYDIPRAAEHAASHKWLLDDLQSLSACSDIRSMTLTIRYLQEWLFRHIDTVDKALGRALNKRGLQ